MFARSLAVLAAVFAVTPVLTATAAPPWSSSSSSCATGAEGPFLYVDTVIPDTAVQCNETQHRLRIETEPSRDGVVVATASRMCRNQSVCRISVDASAPDVPGDQLWCVTARGYVGSTFVGEASSCEYEEF
jgi:hypothetical protein